MRSRAGADSPADQEKSHHGNSSELEQSSGHTAGLYENVLPDKGTRKAEGKASTNAKERVYAQPEALRFKDMSKDSDEPAVYGNAQAILNSLVVDKSRVNIGETIDDGQFGSVSLGTLTTDDGKHQAVAIKFPKINVESLSSDERGAFIKEMATLAQLSDSTYVLKEIAVVINPLLIVMELSNQGSLKKYIDSNDYNDTHTIPYPTLLSFAHQAAQGLKYLSDHNIIHRDVAARNILLHVVSRHKFTCKVSDFGLSRVVEKIIYKQKQVILLPPASEQRGLELREDATLVLHVSVFLFCFWWC